MSHHFSDEEVLDEDFLKKYLIPVMEAAAPFVQYMNEVCPCSPLSSLPMLITLFPTGHSPFASL